MANKGYALIDDTDNVVGFTAQYAGVYMAMFTIDGNAAGGSKNWKRELNIGVAPADNVVTQRATTGTLASMSSGGHLVIAAGDRVWISGKNSTDTTDYTVKNMNLFLHKIS